MYGPDRFISDLRDLGFSAIEVLTASNNQRFVVIRRYEVLLGKFAGRLIDLAIPVLEDYPRSVGASIHIRSNPQLYEKQNIPNVRNVTDSVLGPEWRYWSKNFGWTGERSTRRLLSQINEVFNNA